MKDQVVQVISHLFLLSAPFAGPDFPCFEHALVKCFIAYIINRSVRLAKSLLNLCKVRSVCLEEFWIRDSEISQFSMVKVSYLDLFYNVFSYCWGVDICF